MANAMTHAVRVDDSTVGDCFGATPAFLLLLQATLCALTIALLRMRDDDSAVGDCIRRSGATERFDA